MGAKPAAGVQEGCGKVTGVPVSSPIWKVSLESELGPQGHCSGHRPGSVYCRGLSPSRLQPRAPGAGVAMGVGDDRV